MAVPPPLHGHLRLWCMAPDPHFGGHRRSAGPVAAAGARSTYEVEGASEIQDNVSRREREYERALVQRGDVTLWLSADATDAWRPAPSGRPGGQKRFSDVAIETALILRLVFGLPLRQTEGFVRSVLALMGADLDAPDHTTLSRRSQPLAVMLRRIPALGPIHLIVDSTGLSIVGQGAWAAAKHGGHGKRGWKKLHLGVDRSGVIVAQALTDAHVDDARPCCMNRTWPATIPTQLLVTA